MTLFLILWDEVSSALYAEVVSELTLIMLKLTIKEVVMHAQQ